MNRFRIALVAALSLTATAPTSATAQPVAPPGNSAVDQYRESAPPPPRGSSDLSEERRRRLADRGRDGKALAAALDGSGGVPSTSRRSDEADAVAADAGGSAGDGHSTTDEASPEDRAGADRAATSDGAAGPTRPQDPRVGAGDASTTKAAASATVGPFPVWTMMVGAIAVVAIGLVVRRRPMA